MLMHIPTTIHSQLLKFPQFFIRCPTGWISTDEGSCTDDDECPSEPCYNGGTCINLDNGQGFLCVCASGFTGDVCLEPSHEKMILVANSTYYVVSFILINVIGKTILLELCTNYNTLNHTHLKCYLKNPLKLILYFCCHVKLFKLIKNLLSTNIQATVLIIKYSRFLFN